MNSVVFQKVKEKKKVSLHPPFIPTFLFFVHEQRGSHQEQQWNRTSEQNRRNKMASDPIYAQMRRETRRFCSSSADDTKRNNVRKPTTAMACNLPRRTKSVGNRMMKMKHALKITCRRNSTKTTRSQCSAKDLNQCIKTISPRRSTLLLRYRLNTFKINNTRPNSTSSSSPARLPGSSTVCCKAKEVRNRI